MLVTGPLTRLCSMATCLLRPLTKLTQNSTQSENFDSLTLRYGIVNYIIMCMFGREGPKPYTCTSNVYLASLVSCHALLCKVVTVLLQPVTYHALLCNAVTPSSIAVLSKYLIHVL